MQLILKYKNSIADICIKNKIRTCYLFGSAAKGHFTETSDIDFIIDLEKDGGDYFERFMTVKHALEKLFNRQVDLLVRESIRNPYLNKEIERTQELIYAARV